MYSIPPGSMAVTFEPYSPSRMGTCASMSVLVATVSPNSPLHELPASSRMLGGPQPCVQRAFYTSSVLDLLINNARLPRSAVLASVAIEAGRITSPPPPGAAQPGEVIDARGGLLTPALVQTRIHLDPAR